MMNKKPTITPAMRADPDDPGWEDFAETMAGSNIAFWLSYHGHRDDGATRRAAIFLAAKIKDDFE